MAVGNTLLNTMMKNKQGYITVEKGSVTLNGVSLTVVDSGNNSFSVAIIPYTYEHTNFKTLKAGDKVNIEFDIVGKYIAKMLSKTKPLVSIRLFCSHINCYF
jgi:riboflavin synthase